MHKGSALLNFTYVNSRVVAQNYQTNAIGIKEAQRKPEKQFKTVNQILKESPMLGTTRLGLNFIA